MRWPSLRGSRQPARPLEYQAIRAQETPWQPVPAAAQPRRAGRGGFTLLEVVAALLASGVLLAGLCSVLFVALQAARPDVGGYESTLGGCEALVELTSELRFAQMFLERNDTSVEFTVADRTGNGSDEVIRWEWSGVAGDALTRRLNGGAAANVLQNVHDFRLSYLIDSLTTTESGSGDVTSSEFMLANFEGWPGISTTEKTTTIGTSAWVAEYFQPQGLPPDLTGMAITKVSLRLQKFFGGTLQVSIHKPVAGGNVEPLPNAIGTPATIAVSALPTTINWVDLYFSDVSFSELQSELVIVVKATADNAAYLGYYNDRRAPADSTVMIWTTDSGATWNPAANKRSENDALFRAYGTYTTMGDSNVEITRHFVVGSDAMVQVGSNESRTAVAATEILNRPETPQP